MRPAETVDMVEVGSPLPAEFAPLVFVTTPVVDVPLVVVERAQPAPVISYVARALAEALAAALAPEVENVAPTSAVTCAEQVSVAEDFAPAPIGTCEAPTLGVECIVPVPAVTYAASAAVDEDVAPAPAVFCATLAPMDYFDDSAPAATCAAPTPVSDDTAPAPAVTSTELLASKHESAPGFDSIYRCAGCIGAKFLFAA